MIDLAQKRCIPCEKGTLPLQKKEAEALVKQIKDWRLSEDARRISKEFAFKNFVEAMEFANKITAVAEGEGHHPNLLVGWGRVGIELSTHSIDGLSENDFILAAKIDKIA